MILECSTAERVGSTVFQGDLLDCSSSPNEIALLHSRFNMSAGTSGTCNSGKVHGYSLPINSSEPCYTSQLHIIVSPDWIGKSIKCVYDNGTTTEEIGNISIEQCYTAVITVTPTAGKLTIHVGLFS